jgi:hypothetical protein
MDKINILDILKNDFPPINNKDVRYSLGELENTWENRCDKLLGKQAEYSVDILFSSLFNIRLVPSTRDENKLNHFDRYFYCSNSKICIEIKSLKRVKSFTNLRDDIQLLELESVSDLSNTYYKGWLYGQADILCFQLQHYIMLVPRLELLQWVEPLIIDDIHYTTDDIEIIKTTAYPLYYTKYERLSTENDTVSFRGSFIYIPTIHILDNVKGVICYPSKFKMPCN